MVHHLAPKGVAGFVLANGSMSSSQSGEGEIRKNLVEAELVDCMVALPGQLFYSTQIPACLWFLARGRERSRRDPVHRREEARPDGGPDAPGADRRRNRADCGHLPCVADRRGGRRPTQISPASARVLRWKRSVSTAMSSRRVATSVIEPQQDDGRAVRGEDDAPGGQSWGSSRPRACGSTAAIRENLAGAGVRRPKAVSIDTIFLRRCIASPRAGGGGNRTPRGGLRRCHVRHLPRGALRQGVRTRTRTVRQAAAQAAGRLVRQQPAGRSPPLQGSLPPRGAPRPDPARCRGAMAAIPRQPQPHGSTTTAEDFAESTLMLLPAFIQMPEALADVT